MQEYGTPAAVEIAPSANSPTWSSSARIVSPRP